MMPYLVEFMKYLCGFSLFLALAFTLIYFATPATAMIAPAGFLG
jgi:hypothetical protein